MKLVIVTQYRENYGDPDKPYWKNKFGSYYVVPNITQAQKAKIEADGIPTLTDLIEYDNPMSVEYIIDYHFGEDDEKVCDDWYHPWMLSYDTELERWVAMRHVPREDYWQAGFEGKNESYVMGRRSERENYECEYIQTEAA